MTARSYVIGAALRDAVLAKLPQVSLPVRSCVIAGVEAAWDDCCEGQLAVVMPNAYLTDTFPGAPGSGSANCDAVYLVQSVAVELVRCAATVDDQGNAPTCDQLETEAQLVLADAEAVRQAVISALRDLADVGRIADYQVLDQPALGPEGGCVGTRLNVSVAFINDSCQ